MPPLGRPRVTRGRMTAPPGLLLALPAAAPGGARFVVPRQRSSPSRTSGTRTTPSEARTRTVMRLLRHLLLPAVLGLVALCLPQAAVASPAQVIRDCVDDGTLNRQYSNSGPAQGPDNLPSDLDEYSDCREVISAAISGGPDPRPGRRQRRRRRRWRRPVEHGRRRRLSQLSRRAGRAGQGPGGPGGAHRLRRSAPSRGGWADDQAGGERPVRLGHRQQRAAHAAGARADRVGAGGPRRRGAGPALTGRPPWPGCRCCPRSECHVSGARASVADLPAAGW